MAFLTFRSHIFCPLWYLIFHNIEQTFFNAGCHGEWSTFFNLLTVSGTQWAPRFPHFKSHQHHHRSSIKIHFSSILACTTCTLRRLLIFLWFVTPTGLPPPLSELNIEPPRPSPHRWHQTNPSRSPWQNFEKIPHLLQQTNAIHVEFPISWPCV